MSQLANPVILAVGAAIGVVVLAYVLRLLFKGLDRGVRAVNGWRSWDGEQAQPTHNGHREPELHVGDGVETPAGESASNPAPATRS